MSHTLITFLGGGSKDSGGGRYDEATYRFGDQTYTKNFFGLALLEHLRTPADNKPDKFVVLGTTGSMWDAFYELLDDASPLLQEEYDKYIKLRNIIEDNATQQQQQEVKTYLEELKTQFSIHLGISCEFKEIPYGESEKEQIAILERMAKGIKNGDSVSLDITHGLRHLPMLVVLSAMYLEVVKNVTINGIYYGAMEIW